MDDYTSTGAGVDTQAQFANDKYAVVDGVKLCPVCNTKKFTVDFANSDLFEQGKFPVCIKCYRTTDGRAFVERTGVTAVCKTCGRTLPLSQFSIVGIYAQSALPHISDVCRRCASKSFATVEFGAYNAKIDAGGAS